ncbi:MAG TPA: molybdenum cofactor guanylyltransferase [Chthoniobacterales bacterium]
MRFSAVLLAGGQSTRMGRDKALLEYEGEALWRRQESTLRRLDPEEILISGPPRDGRLTIADEFENTGPLGGIATALRRCSAPLLLVLAVDLPRMNTDFLRSLLALSHGDGVVPRGSEFFEPLAAIYPKACFSVAESALRRGDFSLQNFVRDGMKAELLLPRPLAPDELSLFANLNTPADL